MGLSRRRLLSRWWLLPVGATAGAFGYMGLRAARILGGKKSPGDALWHEVTPQRVASVAELREPWQAVEFVLGGRPCVAVAIERGATPAHAAQNGEVDVLAFSRLCTHQGCPVVLVRDPEVLALAYNHRPPDGKPLLGCPCHYSLFSVSEDGKAVFGQAVKALPRVRLETRTDQIWAVAAEWAPS